MRFAFAQHGDRAHHVQRIFVVHSAACGAHGALLGVPIVGHTVDHGGAAGAAVLDGAAKGHREDVMCETSRKRWFRLGR